MTTSNLIHIKWLLSQLLGLILRRKNLPATLGHAKIFFAPANLNELTLCSGKMRFRVALFKAQNRSAIVLRCTTIHGPLGYWATRAKLRNWRAQRMNGYNRLSSQTTNPVLVV